MIQIRRSLISIGAVANVVVVVSAFSLAIWIGQRRTNSTQDLAAEAQGLFAAASLLLSSAFFWVTWWYATTTRRILDSQQRSTAAAEAQVAVARAEAEHAQAVARAERAHGERLLHETVRARLDASTPTVTMEVGFEAVSVVGLGNPGIQLYETFIEQTLQLSLKLRFQNHGPGPAIISPLNIPDGTLSDELSRPLLVNAASVGWGTWTFIVAAETLVHGGPDVLGPIVCESRSPLTNVSDRHTWSGELELAAGNDEGVSANWLNFVQLPPRTAFLAVTERSYPDGLQRFAVDVSSEGAGDRGVPNSRRT